MEPELDLPEPELEEGEEYLGWIPEDDLAWVRAAHNPETGEIRPLPITDDEINSVADQLEALGDAAQLDE